MLGNVLQLPPVKGRFIFEEPMDDRWKIGHTIRSLFNLFEPLLLEQNFRQGKDRVYAQLCNRAALGNLTKADVDLLKTRVIPSQKKRLFK